METSGGILSRVGERVLSAIAVGLVVLAGVALYRMGETGRAALWSGIWRTAAWVVIAAAVPWSARFFIGRVLSVSSNWAGLGLLVAFGLVDVIAGLMLLGGWPSGGWGWTAALAVLGAACFYNYLVAEYLSEQAGG